MKSSNNHNNGFSLIELSVVLIIIGLLIVSTVGGGKLLESVKLKSIANEANSFMVAQNNFRLSYAYFPGDIPNATSFWSSCTNHTSPNNCNGNGNGIIADTERLRTWQHLALAELIPGSYDGGPTKTTAITPELTTVPLSKYKLSYWRRNGNTGYLLTYAGTANNWAGAITPKEAKHLDTKYDNGIHNTGNITAWDLGPPRQGTGGTYPTDSCHSSSSYTLTFDDNSCVLIFRQQ